MSRQNLHEKTLSKLGLIHLKDNNLKREVFYPDPSLYPLSLSRQQCGSTDIYGAEHNPG
jgi:hypothetical protein